MVMKKLILLLVFLTTVTVITAQKSSSIRTMADKKSSSITYSMKHPLHTWSGTSRNITSVILSDGEKINIRQVAVSVSIATFDSRNANRDSHMLEVTEALRFPNITFSGNVTDRQGDELAVEGELTFHGISRPSAFKVNVLEKSGKVEVSGGFSVTLSDFNIDRPTLMGFPVNDEVRLEFSVVY
jgi:polyisoprenoid-binding protein YceI